MEDDRADDPVAKVWRSSSIGPMELQRLLPVLAASRQTVDEDLRRLIAAAESIGMLGIVVRARNTLAGNDPEGESANSWVAVPHVCAKAAVGPVDADHFCRQARSAFVADSTLNDGPNVRRTASEYLLLVCYVPWQTTRSYLYVDAINGDLDCLMSYVSSCFCLRGIFSFAVGIRLLRAVAAAHLFRHPSISAPHQTRRGIRSSW
jgi:hypothetical protein